MDIHSILERIKFEIASMGKGKIILTEKSSLLNLLKDNKPSEEEFKPQMNWKDFSGHAFPVTNYLLRLLYYVAECFIWLGYGLLKVIRFLSCGKKNKDEDKDLSTFPRVNFVIFVSVIISYIVLIVIIIVFFLKSVLFFNPQGGSNPQGALVIPQDCGKEHYIYLFNSATCWANTGIKVLEGDEIVLSASGSFFGKISLMDSCASNNIKPKYPRSIISYYNSRNDSKKIDFLTRTILMYNKEDARFGSLLMQIKEDNEDFLYASDKNDEDNKRLMQIDFPEKGNPPHISIKKSGVLYFAVNDIYLSGDVIDTIKNETILQDSLDAKYFVFYDENENKETLEIAKVVSSKVDPFMWFEDNVGEILLNITVIRDVLPANSPKPTIMVKTYRWIEEKFMVSPLKFFLWLFLGVLAWILLDRLIGIIVKKKKDGKKG